MSGALGHTVTLTRVQVDTIIEAVERERKAIPYRSDLVEADSLDLDTRLSDVLYVLRKYGRSEES